MTLKITYVGDKQVIKTWKPVKIKDLNAAYLTIFMVIAVGIAFYTGITHK